VLPSAHGEFDLSFFPSAFDGGAQEGWQFLTAHSIAV
jgi:hypothetical protein